MKKRKKYKKSIASMSAIYIAGIISLSAMGIGYATWNNGLNVDTKIRTGYIKGKIEEINSSDFDLDDGEWLSFKYSDDDQILEIKGEVYPSFNENIPLKILDQGSIPVFLKDVDLKDAKITRLKEEPKDKYRRNSYVDESIVESLKLNISPDSVDKSRTRQRLSNKDQDEISNIQEELKQYDRKEDHKFKYEFVLEQSW